MVCLSNGAGEASFDGARGFGDNEASFDYLPVLFLPEQISAVFCDGLLCRRRVLSNDSDATS